MHIKTILQRSSSNGTALIAALLGIITVYPGHALASNTLDLPPPGLYQIDTQAKTDYLAGKASINQHEDGATGDVFHRVNLPDSRKTDSVHKGAGPVMRCIPKAFTAQNPGFALASHCKNQPGTQTKDGFVYKTVCPSGVSTFIARKIDNKTWELTSTTSMTESAPGSESNMDALNFFMQPKPGASAKEREEYAQLMAEMPEMQRQMAKQRAVLNAVEASPDGAGMKGKILSNRQVISGTKPYLEDVNTERWTRIADSCGTTK